MVPNLDLQMPIGSPAKDVPAPPAQPPAQPPRSSFSASPPPSEDDTEKSVNMNQSAVQTLLSIARKNGSKKPFSKAEILAATARNRLAHFQDYHGPNLPCTFSEVHGRGMGASYGGYVKDDGQVLNVTLSGNGERL